MDDKPAKPVAVIAAPSLTQAALIIVAGIVIAVCIHVYFSPWQTCLRTWGNTALSITPSHNVAEVCSRLTQGYTR